MRYNQQDETDRAVIAQVNQMNSGELALFERMQPRNLRHYMTEQKPWLEDEIYFLGIALHRRPSESDIAEFVLEEAHSLRFRAFYALRYPEYMSAISA